MTATIQRKPWDFSHVLELVNTLHPAPSQQHDVHGKDNEEPIDAIKEQDFASISGLGDFSKIFQYLGTPVNSPSPSYAIQAPGAHEVERNVHIKDDYASDGATYVKSSVNGNRNAHNLGNVGVDEQVTDTVSDGSAAPGTPTLTKTQRKKKNRKERRAKEAALAATQSSQAPFSVSVSESEADIISKKAPARKASAHFVPTTPKQPNDSQIRDAFRKAVPADANNPLLIAARVAAEKVKAAKQDESHAGPNRSNAALGEASAAVNGPSRDERLSSKNHSTYEHGSGCSDSTKTPYRSMPDTGATRFLPSTVQPTSNSAAQFSPSVHQTTPTRKLASAKPKHTIEPMTVRSGEDRHWALLMKLIGDFYEDRKHLIAPMNLTTHNNHPKGIHVFVDASNIFIGFNDQLKRSRGIPPWIQVPSVDLSFDALALLMERRRPVAKRVLAGSSPHLPAFDKAKAVGYECSILEKVYKARELTERQIFFKELDGGKFRKGVKAPPANTVATINGGGSGSGSGSGSETNAPQYAPARMIEQGVDEILHLKILESVVDTDEPGTIVLATGDAAQAEYSQGFMAMAERALKKGWRVELVSWSKNISAMYTRREWKQTWGDRFRIVTLDDYAEELLDM